MSGPRVAPLVIDGCLRPDLDRRFVPRATMAQYLGVSAETVHDRLMRGEIPASATRMYGCRVWYCPALVCAVHVSVPL